MLQGVTPQIEGILAAGTRASSNFNCQPWRFKVVGNRIEIHIAPEADTSPYNWYQRASYVAVGAAIENIVLAATAVAHTAKVSYFPSEEHSFVAAIELEAAPGISTDPLEPEIFLRVTNRKKYLPVTLSDREKKNLSDMVEENNYGVLYLNSEKLQVVRLAQLASLNTELMFSNQLLHKALFSHINWSKQEDDARKFGYYIQALELPPSVYASYYILQNWDLAQPVSQLQVQKLLAQQTANVYATSGLFGAIVVPNSEADSFVKAGRGFERLWLCAQKLGFAIEPISAIPQLKLKVDAKEPGVFSAHEIESINSSYAEMQKLLQCEGKSIAVLFRLGGGAQAKMHDSRIDLQKLVIVA